MKAVVGFILLTGLAVLPQDEYERLRKDFAHQLGRMFPQVSEGVRNRVADELALSIIKHARSQERLDEAREETLYDLEVGPDDTLSLGRRLQSQRKYIAGVVRVPDVPQEFYERELEAIANYSKANIKEALGYDPPSAADLVVIKNQVDYLMKESGAILSQKLVGPYVRENLEFVLTDTRQRLTPEAGGLFNVVARPLSSTELNEALDALRKHVEEMGVLNVDVPKSESRTPHPNQEIARAVSMMVTQINKTLRPETVKSWNAREEFRAGLNAWEHKTNEEMNEDYNRAFEPAGSGTDAGGTLGASDNYSTAGTDRRPSKATTSEEGESSAGARTRRWVAGILVLVALVAGWLVFKRVCRSAQTQV